ncbi:DUF551 domain-containing protein [Paludibacterium denitrificans]|uniref:DUF551 domain-containing protein n=1 Tax=Paludibacterium denitrificans TaxID=2675226 RepID=A0A844GFE0_9NEIS|nr:DUF551 domain-containing protein [Paludibacterium denitrificans]MTD33991.1 DUF551 domain-containing protein [Paludibacterium denitrificans]
MDKMREEFEEWWNSEGQKITTGTKGDALIAWQSSRAKPAGEAVALPFAIIPDEMKALRRFHECVTDGEGYDVPKDMMKRPAEIGLVRRVTANIYEHTNFGLSVLNGDFDAPTAQVPDGWRDISTAPKDGRTVLLGYFNSHGNWRPMRGQWFTKEYIDDNWEDGDLFAAWWYETSVESNQCWLTKPTYWMPLPAAPQPKGGEM